MLSVDIKLDFRSYQVQSSFELNKGEVIGLYGKSGIGKSTLLRTIAGLFTPKQANITYDKKKWNYGNKSLVATQERNVGMIFQDFALFPNMTVEQNLNYAQRISSQHIAELIEVLEISDILNKKSSEISGGQKQRTAIGRALTFDPTILLMDEPFSALDDSIKENIKSYLKTYFRANDKMGIIASHDKPDLSFFTNQIVEVKEV